MVAAYRAVDSGQVAQSRELNIYDHIRRYGYSAIYDRPLSFGEIRSMNLAQNVKSAFVERSTCGKDWAEWARDNPEKNKLLNTAMLLAEDDNG